MVRSPEDYSTRRAKRNKTPYTGLLVQRVYLETSEVWWKHCFGTEVSSSFLSHPHQAVLAYLPCLTQSLTKRISIWPGKFSPEWSYSYHSHPVHPQLVKLSHSWQIGPIGFSPQPITKKPPALQQATVSKVLTEQKEYMESWIAFWWKNCIWESLLKPRRRTVCILLLNSTKWT